MTGSSVNFKAVKSASHAVAHASREVAPTYLLPPDKSMGTVVLLDDVGKVSQVLDAKMALASPRAKVDKRYSPVWEGILNLRRPEPDEDAEEYRAECSAVVTDWYKQYEASTGHKVLRVDVHLDEGHMVDGDAVLNAHAHVIADRTNDLGRVIKLDRKQLRALQTMTAEVTNLERGKSSKETRRKHISHHAYKHLAERGRLETQQQVGDLKATYGKELDVEKSKTARIQKLFADDTLVISSLKAELAQLKTQIDGEPARLAAALTAQEAQLNEQYRLDRERMKQKNADALAAGLKKMYSQEDYQALKKTHEADLVKVKKELAEAQAEAAKVPDLVAAVTSQAAEISQQHAKFDKLKADAMEVITPMRKEVKTMKIQITQLQDENAELAAVAAEWAAKARAYKAALAAGTPAHLITTKPTRTAVGPPNDQGATTPLPTSEKQAKDLIKRLQESFLKMVEWVKSIGAGQEVIGSNTLHIGPVKQLDDFHCVQKTGRVYAIHKLADLDNTPALDDPKMEIKYRNGKGTVLGKLGKSGVQI